MQTGSRGRTILVVDDDEMLRELLRALLEIEGYHVQLAVSGESATTALEGAEAPGLILTDLQLPGLHGAELARSLRDAAPSAVILGMSATRPTDDTLRSLDGFLMKPFEAVALEDAITVAQAYRASGTAAAIDPTTLDLAATAQASPDATKVVLDEIIFSRLGETLKPEHIRELYGMTLDDVTRRHQRLSELASAHNLVAVQSEAHAIKGACGFVGARELQALASEIETSSILEASVIAEIPAACLRLRNMLEAKLPSR